METTVETRRCANCQADLSGSFCADCGQRAVPLNPTLGGLVREVVPEVLDLDGRIFRSVRLLLTRPGFLTREWFDGRRTRYVSPLKLYLLFSVLYFGVAALVLPRSLVETDTADAAAATGSGQETTSETPTSQEVNDVVVRSFVEGLPRLMFVLVPVGAWLVHVAARRTGRHYPHHFYFTLHIHAAYFAVLAIVTPLDLLRQQRITNVLFFLQAGFLIAYTAAAFRTAYGGRWRVAIGRTAFVLVSYMLIFTLIITAIVMGVTWLQGGWTS